MRNLLNRIFVEIHSALLRLSIRRLSSDVVDKVRVTTAMSARDDAFKKHYEMYVREISSPEMATSCQCALFLMVLCEVLAAKKIIDLGSGFSSYALRRYARAGRAVEVWSVDDDERWLKKTEAFLRDSRVGSDKMIMLDSFIAGPERDFDLIFMDLNFVEIRRNFLGLVADRCKPGGVIVFDDVHKRDYMYDVLRLGSGSGLRFFDIKSFTMDSFGRFALLGIKQL